MRKAKTFDTDFVIIAEGITSQLQVSGAFVNKPVRAHFKINTGNGCLWKPSTFAIRTN